MKNGMRTVCKIECNTVEWGGGRVRRGRCEIRDAGLEGGLGVDELGGLSGGAGNQGVGVGGAVSGER